jgi:hypothetical protein
MAATYLLRFDDICPTMNWHNWERVERILVNQNIRPLLAVVPDNQDPALRVSAAEPCFWDRAREWQARGWTIGIHGWQHRFVTRNAGIVGVTRHSEFAGLSREVQREKISAATATFKKQGLSDTLWIAPGHSFDHVTVQLLKEFGVDCISDGFSVWPFADSRGILWVPQQLWSFRYRPFGIWTICFHANAWTDKDFATFAADVSRNRQRISNFAEIAKMFRGRRVSVWDSLAADAYKSASKMKALVSMRRSYAVRTRTANHAET